MIERFHSTPRRVGPLLAVIALMAGAAGLATTGCIGIDSVEFACMTDDQCDLRDRGTCETSGWCAYPDDDCPSTRRYDETAGDGLSGKCVEATQNASES